MILRCIFLYYWSKMKSKIEDTSLLIDISSVRMELYLGHHRLADLDILTVTGLSLKYICRTEAF
jgi:hypothetical protein